MIQRIQTLYLVFATVLAALIIGPAIASLIGAQQEVYVLTMNGIYQVVGEKQELIERTVPLMLLLFFIPALNLFTIFLFKKRKIQMRLTMFNLVLMVGAMGLIAYYLFYAKRNLEADIYFSYRLVFPLLAAIFNFLAYRGILKDELLIKSYDRLR